MRIFVTGASGAIGTRLVRQLIARGHEVVGPYRSAGSSERVAAFGAKPIPLDLLDFGAVRKAVLESEPEAMASPKFASATSPRPVTWPIISCPA